MPARLRQADSEPIAIVMRSPPELLGGSPLPSPALPGGVEALRQAVAAELENARRNGFDVAGEALDASGRAYLVHRTPSGELKVVEPLEPFRWTRPERA